MGAKKNPTPDEGKLPVSELLGEFQGPNSPFGDDIHLPLPISALRYDHPEVAAPYLE
jgi:hypothetical protein